jgi:hypothetical protein
MNASAWAYQTPCHSSRPSSRQFATVVKVDPGASAVLRLPKLRLSEERPGTDLDD